MITPGDVLGFWFAEATRPHWFASTPEFDALIRERYQALWQSACRGELAPWQATAEGTLALAIVLDQFPRNMYRGEAKAYASDAQALTLIRHAIASGLDRQIDRARLAFLYLPLMHSENADDQDSSVRLFEAAGLDVNLRFARHHRDIVRRFGRFPHRNAVLGRTSTAEEQAYLASKQAFKGWASAPADHPLGAAFCDTPMTISSHVTSLSHNLPIVRFFPVSQEAHNVKPFLFLLALFAATAYADSPDVIAGAGSSAAFPVYRTWAAEYARARQGLVTYDAIGSSGGIRKIKAGEVDFGGSDVAPPPAELAQSNLIAVPTVISGVVPIYNLPGLKGVLVLNGSVLARIFLGDITRWDAKEIRELNPQLKLPAMEIHAVVRADGSGTTYNFSDYLSKVSPSWHDRRGVSTHFQWPAQFSAVSGSAGVAEKVHVTPGAISYVDYNYVMERKLSGAHMINASGRTVSASPESFRAALRVSQWQQQGDFSRTLTEQGGHESWPITMGTFVLLPKVAAHPEKTLRVIHFFTWAFMHGDDLANRTHFVRLPDAVQAKAFRILAAITDRQGHAIAFETLKSMGKTAVR